MKNAISNELIQNNTSPSIIFGSIVPKSGLRKVYLGLRHVNICSGSGKHGVKFVNIMPNIQRLWPKSQFLSWVCHAGDVNIYHAIAFHHLTLVTLKSPLPNSSSYNIRPLLCDNDIFRALVGCFLAQ